MARRKKKTLEDRISEPGQKTHRTEADKGEPEVWPPALPDETSAVHGEPSDGGNAGRVTSEGPIPLL